MKLSDFKGIFKTNKIKFKGKNNIEKDYYIFDFEVPKGLIWEAGEHGIFTFSNLKIKGKSFRAFSIASSPNENIIKIGTKISDTPSDFKAKMINLNPGDIMNLRGPFGWFKLPKGNKNLLFIAGGIGITPIRGLYQKIKFEKLSHKATLIYISDSYIFKEDLDTISNSENIYTNSRTEFYKEIENFLNNNKPDYIYISGNPKLIKQVSKTLKNNGISKKKIINDPFMGY